MIIDLEKQPQALPNSADVCIVGSGPAGLSLALRLHRAKPALRIAILEGGGLQPSEFSQELYEGDSIGFSQHPLQASRIRAFGGTSNIWSGWCNPLTRGDFQRKSWIEDSGWPIRYESLEPYYQSAYDFFGVNPKGEVADNNYARYPELQKLDTSRVNPLLMKHSYPAMHVGRQYESVIAKASTLNLYLNANLTKINLSEDGQRVSALQITHNDLRRSYSIPASDYVLACGGIENPRILLSSTDTMSQGVGNRHDCVGRYFIEHLHTRNAVVKNFRGSKRADYLKKSKFDERRVTLGIAATHRQQHAMELANAVSYFTNFDENYSDTWYRQFDAAQTLKRQLEQQEFNAATTKSAFLSLRSLDSLIVTLATKAANLSREPEASTSTDQKQSARKKALTLTMYAEQIPNRSSRVRLSEEKDKLGIPQPILDWQLAPQDRYSIRQSTLLVASELAKANVGRLQLHRWLTETDDAASWPDYYISSRHPMGTTRMSSNKKTGVVNADCRVHDISNLYIGGSSVFPTGGYANPTLTIVALSHRLADHLAERALG